MWSAAQFKIRLVLLDCSAILVGVWLMTCVRASCTTAILPSTVSLFVHAKPLLSDGRLSVLKEPVPGLLNSLKLSPAANAEPIFVTMSVPPKVSVLVTHSTSFDGLFNFITVTPARVRLPLTVIVPTPPLSLPGSKNPPDCALIFRLTVPAPPKCAPACTVTAHPEPPIEPELVSCNVPPLIIVSPW